MMKSHSFWYLEMIFTHVAAQQTLSMLSLCSDLHVQSVRDADFE